MKIYLARKHREIGVGRSAPVIREELAGGGVAYYFEGTEEERSSLINAGLLAGDGSELVVFGAVDPNIDFSSAKKEPDWPDEFQCPKHGNIHKKGSAAYFACLQPFLESKPKP